MSSFVALKNQLSEFWAKYGATELLPYDMNVGAGTYHPATVFGVLDTHPLSIFYIQPSRRPQDGRHGESSNRLYQHTQFQVIVKPSPKDAQSLVYKCLDDIGINTALHDIRFIDNNWESPVLGANGVGWEVWCDGVEVCQYTYFQKMGGQELKIIPVEYAFGIERLLIILNKSKHIMEIPWSESMTYKDVRYNDEYEQSEYTFQVARPSEMRQQLIDGFHECEFILNKGLARSAYEVFLRMVHTFNVLHGFGALGVAERQELVLKLRQIANRCCEIYMRTSQSVSHSK